jgi:hypothetical protein
MTRRQLLLCFFAVTLSFFAAHAACGEPTVGVYYYPWYGSFSGGHSVNQSLRGHLTPAQPPALGK